VSVIASLVNLFVSLVLFRAGKKYRSITLEADAKHLMTDVWTSAGVLIGVGAVAFTGWLRLDAIVAFLVACNIVITSFKIIRSSVSGLMDEALSAEEQNKIRNVLEQYRRTGIEFHAFFSRQAGSRQFVSFHVLVPGSWTVARGHQLVEEIEADLRKTIPGISITTHLEPLEDPVSYNDASLERNDESYFN
ncbi:MAG: cation diffusion facilitator family transporter, partial [Chloroflexota bacterium]